MGISMEFPNLPSEFKDILDRREFLPTLIQAINDNKRKRAAKIFFDKKSWKDWN